MKSEINEFESNFKKEYNIPYISPSQGEITTNRFYKIPPL
jgi:hypothetical protein